MDSTPSTSTSSFPTPSAEDVEEALLCCRYGEQADVESYITDFGLPSLADARDESSNTCLHMAAGNGHLDLITYLLPILPPALFSTTNASGSTPLHWASLNGHLPVVKALVLHPLGPGDALIDCRNNAGRTPVGEAEMMERHEVANWLVGRMRLDERPSSAASGSVGGGDVAMDGTTDETVPKEDEGEGEEEEVAFKLSLNDDKTDVVFTPVEK